MKTATPLPEGFSLPPTIAESLAKLREIRANEAASYPHTAAAKTNEPSAKLAPSRLSPSLPEQLDLFRRRLGVLREALSYVPQPDGAEDFEGFQGPLQDQRQALAVAIRFAERLPKRIETQKHPEAGILFYGTTGTGKTFLAKSILKKLAEIGAPGFFISAREYFDLFLFSAQLDRPLWKIKELLAGVSCLVIDEVGSSNWTTERQDRLQQIIDARMANHLPTIVTTNLTGKDFEEGADKRLSSRFAASLYPVKMVWEDYRQMHALSNYKSEELF